MLLTIWILQLHARALGHDDYDGVCDTGRFPLIGTVSRIIRPNPEPTTQATTTTTTTTLKSTTGGGVSECPGDGFIQKSFRLFEVLPMC